MATDDTTIIPADDSTPLTEAETADLQRHIGTIRRGMEGFKAMMEAIRDVRDRRLYRTTHPTFEAFCQEHCDMTRGRVNQLIRAAEVTADLDTRVSKALPRPDTEKQIRPLAPLPPPQRAEAWAAAVQAAEGKSPTAKQVEAAALDTRVSKQTAAPRPKPPEPTPPQDTATADDPDTITFPVTMRRSNYERYAANCKRLGTHPQARTVRLILDDTPKAPATNGKPAVAK